ncbi:putative Tyrosine phosphatase family [Trypanosoma vivax]|nr:putative Tyrosine phosphatase family [Trypanosoma vivax]
MTAPLPAPDQLSRATQEPLVPTINFAMVCPGVYRSGYPTRKNYRFILALGLRTIIYLCPEEYADSNVKFCEENGITICRYATEGNKEPFMDISEQLMHRILTSLIDTRLHPILIHCNKGKHRTGTVAACLRLLQGWSLVSIFQEYRSFAGDKVRMGDMQYVELYRPIIRVSPPHVAEWVCFLPTVTVVRTEEELLEAESRQLGWSLLAPPPQKQKQPSLTASSTVTTTGAATVERVEKALNIAEPSNGVVRGEAAAAAARTSAARQAGEEVVLERAKNDTRKSPAKVSAITASSRRGDGHTDAYSGSTLKVRETSGPCKKDAGDGKKCGK